ncbi:MAG: type I-E CRISPR-associated endoribonuclease Cas2e [Acidimicrobiales bacterium]
MSMTVIVTRDVEDRYRGFLGSCTLELAPGVYTSPRMSRAVRERIWSVLGDWFGTLGRGSIVMTWAEPSLPGGQAVAALGLPVKEIASVDGVLLARREMTDKQTRSLKKE